MNTITRGAMRAVAITGITVGATLAVTNPAFAQQKGGDAQAEASCRAMGGSWNPDMHGGIEGHRCRINVFYGCGFEINYDSNGNPVGGNAWCLDHYVDW